MYIIATDKGFVLRSNGWIHYTLNPNEASFFDTREEARGARPGHHRDMGGKGFHGRVINADEALSYWHHKQSNPKPFGWV